MTGIFSPQLAGSESEQVKQSCRVCQTRANKEAGMHVGACLPEVGLKKKKSRLLLLELVLQCSGSLMGANPLLALTESPNPNLFLLL